MSDGDAVRRALPEDMEVVMKQVVRLETKPERWEERIAVVSDRRVYIVSVAKASRGKKPGHSRVEQTFHLLHVSHIASVGPSRLSLTVKGRPLNMEMVSQTAVDQLIALMLIEIEGHLPVNSGSISLQVEPEERENALLASAERELKQAQQNIGPCGGFVKAYRFLCDYFELPIREDVAWQIDAVYRGANKKSLELRDFAHLAPGDMLPLIASLCFNDFFTTLDCSHVKLTPECQERLSYVFRKNTTLKSVLLEATGLKGDTLFHKIISSIAGNEQLKLEHVDFSHNGLEDKGIQMCAQWLEVSKNPLASLNLANTKCSNRGANAVGRALAENKSMVAAMKRLVLSENSLGNDGFAELGRFVARSSLQCLELQSTSVYSDHVLQCLAEGKVAQTIRKINLSDNKVAHPKKGQRLELSKKVVKMFQSSSELEYLNLANSKFPIELLRGVFQGLQDNSELTGMEVILCGNEFGSNSLGAALNDCCAAIKKISKLDISNNELENDIIPVCAALRSCQTIRELSLGGNFGKSGKVHPQTLQAVGSLIADPQASLESLSLVDSRIRAGIGVILRALLADDVTLKTLDIRGNMMGDVGAHILAKVLQVNTSLHTVHWDRNGTTQVGFRHVAFALEYNYSLLTMPIPLVDGAAVLSPETESLLQRMQELVTRNHSPKSQPEKKKARRQNIITTSVAAEERLDHLVSLAQDKVNLLMTHRKHSDIKDAMEKHEHLMDVCNQASELMGNFDLKEVQHDDIERSLKKSLVDTDFAPLTDLLKVYPDMFVDLAKTNIGDSLDEDTVENLKETADKHATLDSARISKIIHSEASHGFTSAMNDVVYSVAHKFWVGVLNAMVKVVGRWNDELYTLVLACKGRPMSPASPEKAVKFSEGTAEEPADEPESLSLAIRQRKLRRSRPPTISLDEEFDPMAHGGTESNVANQVSPSRMAIFPEFREKMAVLLAEAEELANDDDDNNGSSLEKLGLGTSSPRRSPDKEPQTTKSALPGFLRKKKEDKPAPKEREKKKHSEVEKPDKKRLASTTSTDGKSAAAAADLPDLAPSAAPALTHVTKGRAAPKRTNRGRPARKPAQDTTDSKGTGVPSSHDLFVTAPPEADNEDDGATAAKAKDETDAEVAAMTALMPPMKATASDSPISGSPRASPNIMAGFSASILGEMKKKQFPGTTQDDSPKVKPRSGSDVSKSKSSTSLAPDDATSRDVTSGKSSTDTSPIPTPKPRSPRPAVKGKPKKPIPTKPGENGDVRSDSADELESAATAEKTEKDTKPAADKTEKDTKAAEQTESSASADDQPKTEENTSDPKADEPDAVTESDSAEKDEAKPTKTESSDATEATCGGDSTEDKAPSEPAETKAEETKEDEAPSGDADSSSPAADGSGDAAPEEAAESKEKKDVDKVDELLATESSILV
eukprot:scpid5202/ scgid5552/ Leucine-rich repeat-containing protein 16A; CARMIL homolog